VAKVTRLRKGWGGEKWGNKRKKNRKGHKDRKKEFQKKNHGTQDKKGVRVLWARGDHKKGGPGEEN